VKRKSWDIEKMNILIEKVKRKTVWARIIGFLMVTFSNYTLFISQGLMKIFSRPLNWEEAWQEYVYLDFT
jgi:hypothetical protein